MVQAPLRSRLLGRLLPKPGYSGARIPVAGIVEHVANTWPGDNIRAAVTALLAEVARTGRIALHASGQVEIIEPLPGT